MLTLRGSIQHYDWGSPTTIPAFLGVPADGAPWAEVWYGAHPSHPAMAKDPADDGPADSLDGVIAADPESWLGSATRQRFGDSLPFLVKLLATRRALSIQVHPDLEQARDGYARERARGLVPEQSDYADANHKPEAILALSPLRALVGFRSAGDALRDLRLPGLEEVCAALQESPDASRIRKAFMLLESLEPTRVERALQEIRTHPDTPALSLARDLDAQFPGDRGVLVSLLLREVEIPPGRVLFTGAGVVHAYLEGFGLEVMANSDNVLRAGLTSKRTDVEEFARIADFRPHSSELHPLTVSWPTPGVTLQELDPAVPDFRLGVLEIRELGRVRVGGEGRVSLLMALEGTPVLSDARSRLALTPGQAVLSGATDPVDVTGSGRLALVTVGMVEGLGVRDVEGEGVSARRGVFPARLGMPPD